MNKIQNKLLKFERYLKKNLANLTVKKNIMFRFHDIFMEELKGTESGDKFLEKIQ